MPANEHIAYSVKCFSTQSMFRWQITHNIIMEIHASVTSNRDQTSCLSAKNAANIGSVSLCGRCAENHSHPDRDLVVGLAKGPELRGLIPDADEWERVAWENPLTLPSPPVRGRRG